MESPRQLVVDAHTQTLPFVCMIGCGRGVCLCCSKPSQILGSWAAVCSHFPRRLRSTELAVAELVGPGSQNNVIGGQGWCDL